MPTHRRTPAENLTIVIGSPDLSITQSHSGDFTAGTNSSYMITARNVGAHAASVPTVVTDILPTGLSHVSRTGTGWSCGVVSQTVTYTNGNSLAKDASSTSELQVAVAPEAVPGMTNTVTVSTADVSAEPTFEMLQVWEPEQDRRSPL